MRFYRTVGFLLLSLFTAFFLSACGGGGGSSSNPPPAPSATTMAATGVSLHAATLNGTVNPRAQDTNAWFEWGTDSTLAAPTLTSTQAIGAGSADNSVSAGISGLTLGTTYYYRVCASNASGTKKGTIANFTTASPNSPPVASTNAATSVTVSSATLNGSVNPNELATTALFEWGTNSSLATFSSTTSQNMGAGTTSVAISAPLTGLTPGVPLYFRVAATNSAGTTKGTIATFTPVAQAPTVANGAASSITLTGATLNGTVNPNGLAVSDAHFQWGTDSNLATFTSTSLQTLAAGFTGQSVTASLTGLTPGTNYYFRVVATNSAGTSTGTPIVGFTAASQPPTVTNAAATSLTTTGATLNGTVNPNGLAVSDYHFEYGTDSTLTTVLGTTSVQTLAAGFTGQAVNAPVTGLTQGTTYYFRVVATNSAGTSKGTPILTFNTVAQPAPTAIAHYNETVYTMGPGTGVSSPAATVITLDGASSTPSLGGTITSYAWTQVAGDCTVTLADSAAAITTFTAPTFDYGVTDNMVFQLTVMDNQGGGPGTDNIYKFVKWGYLDDFHSNSIAAYEVFDTVNTGGLFEYDAGGQRASVIAGDNTGIKFQKTFTTATKTIQNTAVFSFDFTPRYETGAGGGDIDVRLNDGTAYLELSTADQKVRKVWPRDPIPLDEATFAFTYVQGTTYHVTISFSPISTTFTATGGGVTFGPVELKNNTNSLSPVYFEFDSFQQTSYFDNIKLEAAP